MEIDNTTLRPGMTVRSKFNGVSYIVTDVGNDSAVAVRTILVTHHNEWEIIDQVLYKQERGEGVGSFMKFKEP